MANIRIPFYVFWFSFIHHRFYFRSISGIARGGLELEFINKIPSILRTTAKFLKIPNYIAFILFEASLIARFISYGKAAFNIFLFANFPSILLFFLINFLSLKRK